MYQKNFLSLQNLRLFMGKRMMTGKKIGRKVKAIYGLWHQRSLHLKKFGTGDHGDAACQG